MINNRDNFINKNEYSNSKKAVKCFKSENNKNAKPKNHLEQSMKSTCKKFGERISCLAKRDDLNFDVGKMLAGKLIYSTLTDNFYQSNPKPHTIGYKVSETLIENIRCGSFTNVYKHIDYLFDLQHIEDGLNKAIYLRIKKDLHKNENSEKPKNFTTLKRTLQFTRDLAFLNEYMNVIGPKRVENWVKYGYNFLGWNNLNNIVAFCSGAYERMLPKASLNGYKNNAKNNPNSENVHIPPEYLKSFINKLMFLELVPGVKEIINNDYNEIVGNRYIIFEFNVTDNLKPKVRYIISDPASKSRKVSFLLLSDELICKDAKFFKDHKLSKYVEKETNKGTSVSIIRVHDKIKTDSNVSGIGCFAPLTSYAKLGTTVGESYLPGAYVNSIYKELNGIIDSVQKDYSKKEKQVISEYSKKVSKQPSPINKLLEKYN